MIATTARTQVPVERVQVAACTIPADLPESDGTFAWRETTLVLVQVFAGGLKGLGYTYADASTARFIESHLIPLITGQDVMAIPRHWNTMVHAVRNLGRPGVASMAISAVDNALWDLKARLLGEPLVQLLGSAQSGVRVY